MTDKTALAIFYLVSTLRCVLVRGGDLNICDDLNLHSLSSSWSILGNVNT